MQKGEKAYILNKMTKAKGSLKPVVFPKKTGRNIPRVPDKLVFKQKPGILCKANFLSLDKKRGISSQLRNNRKRQGIRQTWGSPDQWIYMKKLKHEHEDECKHTQKETWTQLHNKFFSHHHKTYAKVETKKPLNAKTKLDPEEEIKPGDDPPLGNSTENPNPPYYIKKLFTFETKRKTRKLRD